MHVLPQLAFKLDTGAILRMLVQVLLELIDLLLGELSVTVQADHLGRQFFAHWPATHAFDRSTM
ncbi:MAG: hypothetical protein O6933_00960, partial [Planctomycetota bacterium]|nr:hypothetical protein [Planctomycetota bacterium]